MHRIGRPEQMSNCLGAVTRGNRKNGVPCTESTDNETHIGDCICVKYTKLACTQGKRCHQSPPEAARIAMTADIGTFPTPEEIKCAAWWMA
jgi:hypothetical protein